MEHSEGDGDGPEDPRQAAIREGYLRGANPEEIVAAAKAVGERKSNSRSPRRLASRASEQPQ